ncbi:MAG: 30S ribosomal protein S13 [Dehalococcoidales bacterium]|nr:30S ribosomal protein S13 [Dehalococcoidales bacterium]MDZ4247106.1 30S ribosomal protein S13 [Dehalococcoidia bacterium]
MARVAGVEIPGKKHIGVALRYIYGIGPSVSQKVLDQAGIDATVEADNLNEDELNRIREIIDHGYQVEGELRKETNLDIRRLIEIGSYRGMRHRHNLPARGQRTRTNARTRRGSRQTVAGRGKRRGVAKK